MQNQDIERENEIKWFFKMNKKGLVILSLQQKLTSLLSSLKKVPFLKEKFSDQHTHLKPVLAFTSLLFDILDQLL